MNRFPGTQHLVFDADDTLWENNVHFERAVEAFLDWLDHPSLTRDEVRAVIDETELANAGSHGYGSAAFGRNLVQASERLLPRRLDEAEVAVVLGFGERVRSQPLQLIAGVAETLAALAPRHDLTLLTKGQPEEQRAKIERSGLGPWFRRAEIVPEKRADTYLALVADLGLDPARTWMIGNSPKSDINPAIAAALGAVWIPHAVTWRLELQEVDGSHDRLLTVERFADLLTHF